MVEDKEVKEAVIVNEHKSSIWERLSKGSSRLVGDAAKGAPSDKTTTHVWCSAVVVGRKDCPCVKCVDWRKNNGND